jgi:DNA-directed RNA polymerase specialized sigma24 family protein
MTKKEILETVGNNPTYKKILKRLNINNNIIDDVYQELWLMLYEKSEEQIVKLYEKNELERFWTGMAIRSLTKNGPLYKQYRLKEYNTEEFDTEIENRELIEDEREVKENESHFNKLIDLTNDLYWYDREIAILFSDMTIKEIVKETGISKHAVNMSLKRTRDIMREKLNLNTNKKRIW